MKRVTCEYVMGWDCRKIPNECSFCTNKPEFHLVTWGIRSGRKSRYLCEEHAKKWNKGELVI